MIGAGYVFLFCTAHDLPRCFVMMEVGSQPTDVFEAGVFPLPMGGLQYADRKTFLYDGVREDGTRRKLTRRCGAQSNYPFKLSLDHSRRGAHTHVPRGYTSWKASQNRFYPFTPTPVFYFPVCTLRRRVGLPYRFTYSSLGLASGIIVSERCVARRPFALCLVLRPTAGIPEGLSVPYGRIGWLAVWLEKLENKL